MSSPNFRFKRFTVWHDCCAMKVGTDGVLLGAWCPLNIANHETSNNRFDNDQHSIHRVLDIGTGSGLIALMLAQRLENLGHIQIDAIDIDPAAVEQAKSNFALSPWTELLHIHHSALQSWNVNDENYDLIVSNPPYFQDSLKNPNAQRAIARHTDALGYDELIKHSVRLLKHSGMLALVLPFDAKEEVLGLAKANGLYPVHITHIHSKPSKPAKRLLIAFSFTNTTSLSSEKPTAKTFYIESEDSSRSKEYETLTKDFYL